MVSPFASPLFAITYEPSGDTAYIPLSPSDATVRPVGERISISLWDEPVDWCDWSRKPPLASTAKVSTTVPFSSPTTVSPKRIVSSRAYAVSRVAVVAEGAAPVVVGAPSVGTELRRRRWERRRRGGQGRDGCRAAACRPHGRDGHRDDGDGRSRPEGGPGALVTTAARDGDGREVPGHLDAVGVLPEQRLELVLLVWRGHDVTSFILLRNELIARLVWLLTVPTETPRISAVWASVRSS